MAKWNNEITGKINRHTIIKRKVKERSNKRKWEHFKVLWCQRLDIKEFQNQKNV